MPPTSVWQQQISSPFKETECAKGPLLPHKEKMKFFVDLPSTQCSCSFAGLELIIDHRKLQGHALKEAQIQLVLLISWWGGGGDMLKFRASAGAPTDNKYVKIHENLGEMNKQLI